MPLLNPCDPVGDCTKSTREYIRLSQKERDQLLVDSFNEGLPTDTEREAELNEPLGRTRRDVKDNLGILPKEDFGPERDL